MNKKPHIKILVLNWNGDSIISRCIDSIQSIKYRNYSLDIIDNGSTDNSVETIKNNYPNVKIHSLKQNLGYAKGYNYIFNRLKKNQSIDYYLILNNDAIVSDNLLDALYDSAIRYGLDNIYGPKINYLDENKLWFAGGYYNKYIGLTKHIGIRNIENNIFYKANKTSYISGCCMFIKKSLIESLEGFSEIYSMYYEDVDLCHRANISGFQSYIVDQTLIYHDVSYSIGPHSLKKNFYQFISRIKFVYKFNNFIVFLFSLLINIVLLPFFLLKIFYK
ncbi:MAG: hypothetical protein CMG66_04165 [Candidatus Marinimicrobia bacterium]|nr:hypothetical protein [Candidatus Neomarinimicrobiota bacterium]|tara:strand:+ start:6974 stop:7801 length:828 start_codon:yes stop_codon:yes gene_type:complete